MLDEKVPRKSNATSSGSRQIPGGRLVGFALAWVLGEPGWVIAALEDLDSLAKARVCHAGRNPREARLPLKLPFGISERLAHFETVPPRRTKCVVLRRRPARSQPALPRPIYDSVWYYGCVILRF